MIQRRIESHFLTDAQISPIHQAPADHELAGPTTKSYRLKKDDTESVMFRRGRRDSRALIDVVDISAKTRRPVSEMC